jgi:uncharacterized protein
MSEERKEKVMNKKRLVFCMMIVMMVLTCKSLAGCASSKEEIPTITVKDNVYIYDEDDIIDEDVENSLNQLLIELEEKTSVEFVVVSVSSLSNKSVEEYSNKLFNNLGIGKKQEDNGILLLISRSDEKVRLEIGRGLEGVLTDSKCGRILDDDFVLNREESEYTTATEQTVKAVVSIVAEQYGVELENLDKNDNLAIEEDDNKLNNIVFWVIVILVIIICILGAKDDNIGGFHGGHCGGHYGGFSSGGFGGGFSGGGFSGGGGASR